MSPSSTKKSVKTHFLILRPKNPYIIMGKEMKNKAFDPCPLCHGLEAKVLFSSKTAFSEFFLVQCQICGLTRTSPFPDDEILRMYDIYSYYGKDVNKFSPHVQRTRNFIMRVRAKRYLSLIPVSTQTPKILDVGCAEGRLLQSFLEYGCQCWGIEHPFLSPHKDFLTATG